MKLNLYITQKQFNHSIPVEADSSMRCKDDLGEQDVNIEFLIVVLMLSREDLKLIQETANTTAYPKVAFYHRGECIDAVFYEHASNEHPYEYLSRSVSLILSAL